MVFMIIVLRSITCIKFIPLPQHQINKERFEVQRKFLEWNKSKKQSGKSQIVAEIQDKKIIKDWTIEQEKERKEEEIKRIYFGITNLDLSFSHFLSYVQHFNGVIDDAVTSHLSNRLFQPKQGK
ncbi:hypothetical protein ACH5RR_008811 [Cinchona calisaya]|uniref:Uncharacterized protein n=1 Tax=Cinchona calisaya TaxID=153742 RepID=A0ABD3AE70_9GENT